MTFRAAKCPGCGGDLQVPDDRDTVKCMYCGDSITVREVIQAASGTNTVNLMKLARTAANGNNYQEAYGYYTKVLEFNPENVEAWFGKGESAGWMSTLLDFRISEMVTDFDNAIELSQDEQKGENRKRAARSINLIVIAYFELALKHLVQFLALDDAWVGYLNQCSLMLAALERSHEYNPNDKETIEGIIFICKNNIEGYGNFEKVRYVSDEYEAGLRSRMDKYAWKMRKIDPTFKKPEAKRQKFWRLAFGR